VPVWNYSAGEMKWASGSSLLAPLDIWAMILRVKALACASLQVNEKQPKRLICASLIRSSLRQFDGGKSSQNMSCLFVCLRTPDPRPCVSVRVCTRMCVCLRVVETAKVNCFVDSGKRGKIKRVAWTARQANHVSPSLACRYCYLRSCVSVCLCR
jgi:hypothetical protein